MTALAGSRYAHEDGHPDVVRWGAQPGSIYMADQKLPISVPRVRDQRDPERRHEIPLVTYAPAPDATCTRCGAFPSLSTANA